MRDIFAYEVASTTPQDEIVERIRQLFPEFNWRGGDSDMQGPYQSGTLPDGTNLKIWFGERPFDVLLSFSQMPKTVADRDVKKAEAIRGVMSRLVSLGSLVDVTAK